VAEQKFGQLPPGQQFIWQGRKWQKTSPLLACAEGTAQPRIIPRSARVMLADNNLVATNSNRQADQASNVRTALQQLQAETLEKMEFLQLHPEHFHAIREILFQATENALRKINHPS
jgi:hypothetical protein